jgi:hypothetical protein
VHTVIVLYCRCPRRLVPCPRRCGEYIVHEEVGRHLALLCVNRPAPPLVCRLGCGMLFEGGRHHMLQVCYVATSTDDNDINAFCCATIASTAVEAQAFMPLW